MLADFCSLFLEHGPHSGQRQLLENVLHLFWWVGHISSEPPFEQGEKGPDQVLRGHWQWDRRRTFFCTEGGEGRFNRPAECRLQGFPQGLARTASHQRPKLLIRRVVDMLKQLQTGHDPLPCWCMGDLVREHLQLLCCHTAQDILFIEIMGIEGSTANSCPIQNILLGFAIGLRHVLHTGRGSIWGPILLGLYGLSFIGAGIFVTDPVLGYPPGASSTPTVHGILHDLFGQLQFISLSVACFVLARRDAAAPAGRGWAWYSVATGLLVAVSDVAFALTFKLWDGGPAGLIERIGIIGSCIWVALLVIRLLSKKVLQVSVE
jgi:hypothetical protein